MHRIASASSITSRVGTTPVARVAAASMTQRHDSSSLKAKPFEKEQKRNYSSSAEFRPQFRTRLAAGILLLGGLALGVAALSFFDEKKQSTEAAGAIEGTYGTNSERTFIAVKPDGVQRGLVGDIIQRFERRGYKLVAIKVVQPTEAFAKAHYADLAQKPFFPGLVRYFSSGPVVAMVWEGKGVIAGGRKIIGATNPANAEPGSIRGDFCVETGRNIIHGSDGKESAAAEIALWFKPNEVAEYKLSVGPWIYEKDN